MFIEFPVRRLYYVDQTVIPYLTKDCSMNPLVKTRIDSDFELFDSGLNKLTQT